MPSYDVTFLELRKISVWLPEGATDKQKRELAHDHMSWSITKGGTGKLLNIEPTEPVGGPASDAAVPIK